MENYSSVRRSIAGRPLYIHSQKMGELLALLELRGASTGHKALASPRAARPQYAGDRGAIAVIPIQGVISHRGSILSWLFGGTSTSDVSAALRQVVADPNISAIVLDVDSPGGDVDGVDELASEIYQARKAKPITAVSNCLCASAAYYLASQASEIVASPSSLTGSVGVYILHEDLSRALDNAGVKMSMIKFGDNKGEGNPYEPLSDPAREHLQKLVNVYGRAFEQAVARGRGLKQDDVHSKFGQGRVFDANRAVKLGMADRVGTLNSALSTLSTSSGRRQAQLAVTRRIAGTSAFATPAQAREAEFFRMRHELAIAKA